jgi:hypothetical protein
VLMSRARLLRSFSRAFAAVWRLGRLPEKPLRLRAALHSVARGSPAAMPATLLEPRDGDSWGWRKFATPTEFDCQAAPLEGSALHDVSAAN